MLVVKNKMIRKVLLTSLVLLFIARVLSAPSPQIQSVDTGKDVEGTTASVARISCLIRKLVLLAENSESVPVPMARQLISIRPNCPKGEKEDHTGRCRPLIP